MVGMFSSPPLVIHTWTIFDWSKLNIFFKKKMENLWIFFFAVVQACTYPPCDRFMEIGCVHTYCRQRRTVSPRCYGGKTGGSGARRPRVHGPSHVRGGRSTEAISLARPSTAETCQGAQAMLPSPERNVVGSAVVVRDPTRIDKQQQGQD